MLLTPHKFRKKFFACLAGEENEFSPFVRGPFVGRPRGSSAEWAALRSMIFERDDYTCRYCGERGGKLECDHVLPVSRGGSDDPANLVTACLPCNRSKHAKTPEEWLQ